MPRKAKAKGKLKLKTHKATSKRFRLTGSGKLMRTKGTFSADDAEPRTVEAHKGAVE